MTDDRAEIRTGFVRQRRNLMALSLVLLAFLRTGATIKTVHVLGNEIDLGGTLSLTLPLWIAWTYLCIRYYQHFRDLRDRGFATAYTERLSELAAKRAVEYLKRKYKPNLEDFPNPGTFAYDVTPQLQKWGPPIWQYGYAGSVTIVSTTGAKVRTQSIAGLTLDIPHRYMRPARIRAVWWVLVHTRLFTEYVLPFMVAMLPPVFAVVQGLAA